jgi:hypothetical protein
VQDKLLGHIKGSLNDQERGSCVVAFAGMQGSPFVGMSETKENCRGETSCQLSKVFKVRTEISGGCMKHRLAHDSPPIETSLGNR